VSFPGLPALTCPRAARPGALLQQGNIEAKHTGAIPRMVLTLTAPRALLIRVERLESSLPKASCGWGARGRPACATPL